MLYSKNKISVEQGIACVGEGWAPIIEHFYAQIEKLKTTISVAQIKEKFGTLRIYFDVITTDFNEKEDRWEDIPYLSEEVNEFHKFVDGLEKNSSITCEGCGMFGRLRPERSWWKTLCDVCFEEGH